MNEKEFDEMYKAVAYNRALRAEVEVLRAEIGRMVVDRDELIAAMQHPSYEEENRLRAENARLRYELTAAQEGLQTLSAALKTLLNEIQSTSGEGE